MAETLKRSEILRRRTDITRVLTARRIGDAVLSLRCCPSTASSAVASSDMPPRRVAFLISRGLPGAVQRNRLKRRLREIYRRNKSWFPAGCDCVIQAGPRAAELDYKQLQELLAALGRRATDVQTCS